jgi:hypothetical protein
VDELRFLFSYPLDSVRAESRDDPPQRVKHKIDAEKRLISILWSINGIYSLLDMPRGTRYNTKFFAHAVMLNLIENVWLRTRRKKLKRCLMHMDNARPHNSGRAQQCVEASRAEGRPRPAYSPGPK